MSLALFSLPFQGAPTVVGALAQDDLLECKRFAFPLSPPRGATDDTAYRACKISPLRSGRLLLSFVANRGERDVHGRAVLRATGCVLDREAMSGPVRDPGAVWAALQSWEPGQAAAEFESQVANHSAWTSDPAFTTLKARLIEEGAFLARMASVLVPGPVDISWGPGDDPLVRLAPALALLPAQRLFQLELATSSVEGDPREAVLCVPGPVEQSDHRSPGLLGGLRSRRRQGPVTIDLASRSISQEGESQPLALIELLTDAPWPGISERERFRITMACIDASWLHGRPTTPFELSPELEAMRRSVRRLEELTSKLGTWR